MKRRLRRASVVGPLVVALLAGGAVAAWQLGRSDRWQLFGELVTRVPAASPVVARIRESGYRFATVSELLGEEGRNAPRSTGRQP